MEKLKIFVSAYACEPNKGSEIGVGWHWVLEMSKYFELWVLTRSNNQPPIEEYFSNHPEQDNIHWVYYDCPNFIKKFKKGIKGVRTYYTFWQYGSNSLVKKVMLENNIKVFHLLTYGNALWHVSSFGQKQFFIWGPTGGVDTIPNDFSKHYGLRNSLVEAVRRFVVATLPLNFGFKNRCKNANLILCKSQYTVNAIPKKHRHKAVIFTDVATNNFLETYEQNFNHEPPTEYLIIGKLDAWRGFDLLIEAFKNAVNKNSNIHLTIMGKGSDKQRLEKLIKKYNLSKFVKMIGEVKIDEYYEYLKNADVIVNPSLKEGAVTVSFDAMRFGKPFICVDTKGYSQYFNNDYAIVLKRNNRQQLISDLEKAVLLLTDVGERKRLSDEIIKQSDNFTWTEKGKQIKNIIDEYTKGL
ncbi:MAG: glycosyltransferase [Clostridia bacterium]|nr:glycosyltransferase [Clostridia bacterium]